MLYLYVIPSFITGIITFSWYSIYGYNFFRSNSDKVHDNTLPNASIGKWKHNVPAYMLDLYKSGSSEADVVRGVTPKFLGPYFRNRYYPNHGKQQLEFDIPEAANGETLIDAEIRIITKEQNVSFQVFHKAVHWVFLDAKTVPSEGADWLSLKVMPSMTKDLSIVSFLMLTVFRGSKKRREASNLQPYLLLSYMSPAQATNHTDRASHFREMNEKPRSIRRKRNLFEHYEEETNRIWDGDAVATKQLRVGNICRRKPLYIEFSEIDFDTWIVAPTGYEAFQCVGKCTFPVGEHLSPTKHAIVQTLMHHVSPTKVGRACCVPTRLDPISVLYVDSNGVLTYRFHYHGMVVAECGCR